MTFWTIWRPLALYWTAKYQRTHLFPRHPLFEGSRFQQFSGFLGFYSLFFTSLTLIVLPSNSLPSFFKAA